MLTAAPSWLCGVSTLVAVTTTGSVCLTSTAAVFTSGVGSAVPWADETVGSSRASVRIRSLRFTAASSFHEGVDALAPGRSPDSWIVAAVHLPMHRAVQRCTRGAHSGFRLERTALPTHSG